MLKSLLESSASILVVKPLRRRKIIMTEKTLNSWRVRYNLRTCTAICPCDHTIFGVLSFGIFMFPFVSKTGVKYMVSLSHNTFELFENPLVKPYLSTLQLGFFQRIELDLMKRS